MDNFRRKQQPKSVQDEDEKTADSIFKRYVYKPRGYRKPVGGKVWLSDVTADTLDADADMARCALKLFKGPERRVPPLVRRVRKALFEYQHEALSRLPPALPPRQLYTQILPSSYPTASKQMQDELRSTSIPPPSSRDSDRSTCTPGLASDRSTATPSMSGSRPTTASTPESTMAAVASGSSKGSSAMAGRGNSPGPVIPRAAIKGSTKCRLQLDDSEKKTCQLARSCRRMHKDESAHQSSPLSPRSWMLKLEQRRKSRDLSGEVILDLEDPLIENSEKEEDDGDDTTDKELTHFQAHDFAQQMNLPSGQVTDAWRKFKRYDTGNRGYLTAGEFQLLLRDSVRDRYPLVKDIPRDLFQRAATSKPTQMVKFHDFLVWLSQNAFNESLLLSDEQLSLREMARELQLPVPMVENLKQLFDTCDANKDGLILYEEFRALFCKLLDSRISSNFTEQSLPDSRARSFWIEINGSKSGAIEFGDFLFWYLRYYDQSGDAVGSIMECYYESIRPVPKIERRQRY